MKKPILILALWLCVAPLFSQTLSERYQKHIEYLAGDHLQGRAAATRGDTLAVEYIVSQLSAIDGVTLLGDGGIQVVPYRMRISRTDTTRIPKTTFNVVGLIEAQNPQYRHRTVVMGAHYDHLGMRMVDSVLQVFNGADDNASGTAFIIESARELAKRRSNLKANVIVILFGGEEAGLIGSRYYANNPLRPLGEVKAMLNFDMVGRMAANGITVRGLGSAKEALELFGGFKNPDKIDLIFEMRGNGPTDYSSFYGKGIPSFSYSTRQHNDYHRPTDTPEKINYTGMVVAHDYIWQMVEVLAFSEREVTYKVAEDPVLTAAQLHLARLEKQVAMDTEVVDFQKATVLDLQDLVKAGKLTYKQLAQMFLNRIELYDLNTIKLNAVRTMNPNAIADAERCDLAFAANPKVAKGMFGIPVLIKDNINVVGMPVTAGSVALADNYPPYDAPLVTKLKASGAVILGKVNLTEFANYLALKMSPGFSSLGGQVRNPYRPVRLLGDTLMLIPSGSSAGSGAAAAAALAAVTIGTETSGSILYPSYLNSVTGIKPTMGLISQSGIIPLSSTQDVAGPMCRNVTDATILLSVLSGVDYTPSLALGNLKGKRIGLVGIPAENLPAYAPFQKAVQALKDAGVEVVTKPDGTPLTYYNPENPNVNPQMPSTIIMDYDFAKDLPAYLATLDKNYPIKTLKDIIDFNNAYMKRDSTAFPYGQAVIIRCNELDLEAQKETYTADREKDIRYSRENGIDYLLKEYNLDCIATASNVNSTTLIGAKAGYPTVSIPLANPGGTIWPNNLQFTGPAFSEAQLISFAYTVEQATRFRVPPGLACKRDLEETLTAAQELPAEKRALFQEQYDLAWSVYQSNFSIQTDVNKANESLRAAMGK